MSCTSEVGISPVLLQAISHTLTSTENQETVDNTSTFDRRHETNGFYIEDSKKAKEATSAILQFASDQESETKIVPILHGMHEPTAPLIRQVQMDGNGLTDRVILDASPEVKAMLKQKINQRVIFRPHSDSVNISDGNMSFVNVYTTIENAEMKSRDLSGLNHEIKIIDGRKYAGSPDVIVCYNHDSTLVPSPANDIIVSDSDNGMMQSSSPLKHQSSEQDSASPTLKFNHQLGVGDDEEEDEEDEDEMGTDSNSNSQVIENKECVQTIYISQSEEIVSFPVHTISTEASPKDSSKNCPVCEDKVSGYHYGIFSCESCKGFFKRTVQNIKEYKCHQKGNCEINVYNRKKCPACRFTKCIEVGMKLEAIRVDRTRGGRSSYDGCSPHGRARERHTDKRKFQKLNTSKLGANQPTQQQQQHSVVTIPGVPLEAAGQNKASQLVAILSRKNNSMGNIFSEDKKPFVPQILTDIMNLESFLCDDEPSIDILPKDPSSYTSLMQITEVRLYKIVRWARNLAQFTSISTDDQILLLQNCWSDLLLLECCYRSKEKPTEIRLAQGNTISVEVANSLGMGSVVSMVVELAEQLNRLKVDLYEFVGLKVLVLITPDVKGLKNPEKTREHQEKLCEALDMYTSSHYPQHPNKFGEMILTLPTLSRISIKGKELITDAQLKNISSYGLLYELLKGENAIKDASGTSSA